VEVRRAQLEDAATIARIYVNTVRVTYRGIIPDKFLNDMSYDRHKKSWEEGISDPNNRTTVFVAEDDGGRVVGFAECGATRDDAQDYKGELYAIYVNHNMQRKGLGRRLVLSAVQDLRARGFDSMLIRVLADNKYNRFYESIGGTQFRMGEVTFGGKTIHEFAYGWRDTDALITRLTSG
jgi:ribosomal protein S18 acetylase RimI-like enzyme